MLRLIDQEFNQLLVFRRTADDPEFWQMQIDPDHMRRVLWVDAENLNTIEME